MKWSYITKAIFEVWPCTKTDPSELNKARHAASRAYESLQAERRRAHAASLSSTTTEVRKTMHLLS